MTDDEIDQKAGELCREMVKAIWSDEGDQKETLKGLCERIFPKYPQEVIERFLEPLPDP